MSFESLLQELADPVRPLAVSKLIGISSMGAGEASLFMNAWLEMDDGRRQWLVQELLDLAEDNVELNFDAVFFIGLADRDAGVRRAAIQGLWEHEGRDLIDALVGLLEGDPDAAVRAEAALALGRFVLQAEFDTLRSPDAERVDGALRRAYSNTGETLEVRARALESVGARSAGWAHDLIQQAFESPERRLRISAVHAMGRSCDSSWLSTLIAELESEDPEMRYEAASACGAIADREATPHLMRLLHDDDREVQEAAIGALGEIGGAEAKRALQELLDQGDQRVREAVLSALAEVEFAEDPLAFKLRG